MKHFTNLHSLLNQTSSNLSGVSSEEWQFIFKHLLEKNISSHRQNYLIIMENNDAAFEFATNLNIKSYTVNFFPGLDSNVYSGVINSDKLLYDRFEVLNNIKAENTANIVVTTWEGLATKLPPPSFFFDNNFTINVDDIIAPIDLSRKLVELGYTSSISVEEPGVFSKKGQIFDIYPVAGQPCRLTYFDDLIESIHAIDPETNKTIKGNNGTANINSIKIIPAALILTKNNYPIMLRENIPQVGPGKIIKYKARQALFERIAAGELFENYPVYLPLFFNETATLLDYFSSDIKLICIDEENSQKSYFNLMDFGPSDDNELLPELSTLYDRQRIEKLITSSQFLSVNKLNLNLYKDSKLNVQLSLRSTKNFLNEHVNPTLMRHEYISAVFDFLKCQSTLNVYFSSYSENSREEIKYLADLHQIKIQFIEDKIECGFYYESENFLLITEGDLFSVKKKKVQKTNQVDLDLFAEQLATLKIGDYVIHQDHGIAEYLGLESMEIAGFKSDFLILKYSENDKVYVPVYKLNQIQKHASKEAELKPDSLRTNKFQILKEKARTSAKTLAFDLIKLQAERESSQAYAFNPPDHLYREFELLFPFEETIDQARAIDSVLNSMQKSTPMDFLVCGDVGFGKTEVAMRASFKAVEDKKQVAVLVPTTILALQHYNSFLKRFKDFPIKIEFVSRFKTAKEIKEIYENVRLGLVDIIIGTHKILSDQLAFKDLGLVVVDEEQRFGVGHKEKLKLMKSAVDFLTLTATPIPRTLQLAFLGLRDLALIKTAPPRRQSIKSYIIKEDDLTIQMALQKELKRGGQVFIVHNKVSDIEDYTSYIRELVPEAKITYAHGQMNEKELEDRINQFYQGKFQILISTTIIESGIDIPNANTMIVDRADTFGLAQLHQLRGRIGRSDKKAYAYFVIPIKKEISTIAQKRLHAIQTYADMGAGFNIANVDLEIRGAGDILGASQSGHIEAIGLEQYMLLLKEAINELKGERKFIRNEMEMSAPFPTFIPHHYITDPSARLYEYKRLSNTQNTESLKALEMELQDIYGHFPVEVINLFILLETRLILAHLGIKTFSVATQSITIKFDQNRLNKDTTLAENIVKYFTSRPKIYTLTPDYKVVFRAAKPLGPNDVISFANEVSKEIGK